MQAEAWKNSTPERESYMGRMALAFVLLSLSALVAVPVLIDYRVNLVRSTVEDVTSPGRTLVTQLQFALSREMSALRGLLLTSDQNFLTIYTTALTAERETYEQLEPMAEQLGGEVLEHFVEARTLTSQWHARVDEDSIVGRGAASQRYLAAISIEQELFEEALEATISLDAALTNSAQVARAEIRRIERFGMVLSVMLALLALASALAVGWLAGRMRNLAREAERRRAEAEQALADSARATQARARLIRGVSHDVKNPLGAANGYAELLEMELKGPLTEEQAKLVSGVKRSIDGALAIIEDLLDIARADSNGLQLNRKPVDLAALLRDAARDHTPAAEAAGLGLMVGSTERLEVHSDPLRVTQVLGNLISNAIKYTPSPGTVTVRLEKVERGPDDGRWAAIHVTDSGPGIPEDQREAIFDEFTRLENQTSASGHGLGLSIARRIAKMLGGELTVDSVMGEGSTFTIWLPLRTEPAGEPRPARKLATA